VILKTKKIVKNGDDKMPNAVIDGSIIEDIEVKRVLVKEITDALEKAYKFPRQAYVVTIKENKKENVGVGGELVIDKFK
jgi:4-oxalocrotonate tautomerase